MTSEHAPLFFNGWYNLGRAAVLALLGFTALIIVLRMSGKRTLSKLNVFDFVFVVAVGSVFAASIVEKDVTLLEGFVAMATLVIFQTVLAHIAARSRGFERLLNGEPTLLFSHGQFLHRALRQQRVTEEEVRAAIREQGVTRVEDVDAVVLENDGSLTVAWTAKKPGESSLVDAAVPRDERAHKHRKRG
ncbi:MAG TPA: YetF domain-containing protein [Gemmatimonadaceae bacterium]|nr:YetF domain-containing protein [Gemmatimonadaceae bacterium]